MEDIDSAFRMEEEYNIPYDRIIVKSMDKNLEQPYGEAAKNRVVICVAE